MDGPRIPVVGPLPFREVSRLAYRFAAKNPGARAGVRYGPADGWWRVVVVWPSGLTWLLTAGFDRVRGENVFCNTEVLDRGPGRSVTPLRR